MSRGELEVEGLYDVELTLFPSFNYALVRRYNGWYVFRCGSLDGAAFRADSGRLRFIGMSPEIALEASGLWFNPEEERGSIGRGYRWLVDRLLEAYGGVRLSINTVDRHLVLAQAYLSRNTDYHVNVVRWTRFLCECGFDNTCLEEARRRYRSYQLYGLDLVLREFEAVRSSGEAEVLKRLLSLKGVGPKIVTAFLLFSSKRGKVYAPPDKNFVKLLRRLGVAGDLSTPNKELCTSYLASGCEGCPRRERCVTGFASRAFGELAGWVQTVFYVHSKLLCRRRSCRSCVLRDACYGPV